jgi:hypothetical protein
MAMASSPAHLKNKSLSSDSRRCFLFSCVWLQSLQLYCRWASFSRILYSIARLTELKIQKFLIVTYIITYRALVRILNIISCSCYCSCSDGLAIFPNLSFSRPALIGSLLSLLWLVPYFYRQNSTLVLSFLPPRGRRWCKMTKTRGTYLPTLAKIWF